MNLIGITGISKMLGVSRQRASQLSNTKGFPKRLDDPPLENGPVYRRDSVERWASKREERLGRASKDAAGI